jgi:hypothetical protein
MALPTVGRDGALRRHRPRSAGGLNMSQRAKQWTIAPLDAARKAQSAVPCCTRGLTLGICRFMNVLNPIPHKPWSRRGHFLC